MRTRFDAVAVLMRSRSSLQSIDPPVDDLDLHIDLFAKAFDRGPLSASHEGGSNGGFDSENLGIGHFIRFRIRDAFHHVRSRLLSLFSHTDGYGTSCRVQSR